MCGCADSLDQISSAYPIGLGHKRLPGCLGQILWLYIRLCSLQAWYLGIASFEFVLIVFDYIACIVGI